MASTLSNVLDGLVALLQGSAGSTRTIAAGSFKRVERITPSNASSSPRPFLLFADDETEDEELPSDLAGNYFHRAWNLQLVVGYADKPNDRFGLQKTMADDEKSIVRTLTYRRNWATVADWHGLEVSTTKSTFGRQPFDADDPASPEVSLIVINLVVSYREDMS